MKYFGKTDIGKLRKGNQDNFGIYEIAENALLLSVCDGMGGASGGGEASRLALEAFAKEIKDTCASKIEGSKLDASALDIKLLLSNAAECANNEVYKTAQAKPELQGMGTTLVALFVVDGTAFSINVGDSRMYRIKNGEIKQVTHDHSYVQYLVDMGKMTLEEAKKSTNRNIITRAIGTGESIEADIEAIDLEEGAQDTYFLLCSDGLTNVVSDEEIARVVSLEDTPEEKVCKLIETANQNGGPDNITVVLLSL